MVPPFFAGKEKNIFADILNNVKQQSPLVHNITNYVTVNDCANMVLACGASPIMADDPEEVEEITSICAGLNINLGTLNSRTVKSMLLAGKQANRLCIPAVLDPVGVGASALRTRTAQQLLQQVKFAVVRGNVSEIKCLATGIGSTKGVDAALQDKVTPDNLDAMVAFAKDFAAKTGAVVAMTGAIDIVCNADTAYCIYGGHPMIGCYRHRVSAVGPYGGLCGSQPGQCVARCRCCGVRHGAGRANCPQPPCPWGGQRQLPHQNNRRYLQHDPTATATGGKI